jgi:hypothetical protein
MENQNSTEQQSEQQYETRLNAPREKSERTYRIFRSIYDYTMATLILGCGVLMLGAKWFHLDMIINAGADFRYIFGSLCLLYGGFRLYRGINQMY